MQLMSKKAVREYIQKHSERSQIENGLVEYLDNIVMRLLYRVLTEDNFQAKGKNTLTREGIRKAMEATSDTHDFSDLVSDTKFESSSKKSHVSSVNDGMNGCEHDKSLDVNLNINVEQGSSTTRKKVGKMKLQRNAGSLVSTVPSEIVDKFELSKGRELIWMYSDNEIIIVPNSTRNPSSLYR